MLFAVVVTYSLIAHASAYSLTSTISRKSCISMSSELGNAKMHTPLYSTTIYF